MTAAAYLAGLPFSPDAFQVDAAAAIDRGETVVVTAPTGAGKTVVAEAAIHRALEQGRRALYTTPLKALSNQKFGDLRRLHGDDRVGLLTGDNSINGTAPVVVMTTEVLRNMMYAGSTDLDTVATVILDEVHYLQDRSRGAVWEEIIVHLDPGIPLVCLSATVANAPEFAAWVESRRGATSLVVETTRPVPLESLYLLKDRWDGGAMRLLPVFEDAGRRPNSRIGRMLRQRQGKNRRYDAPRRVEVGEFLHHEGLLPAIYFIFSRAGCDAAAAQVVDHRLRLTTAEEAVAIRRVAEERTAHLSPADLAVLGYGRWLHDLEAGVAPHHAGLVPAFKETTERLFSAGLVKLVFATETLALGINMPARTVVLESLSKFTGDGHELMQAGDYTQLTGRAGRRGIDTRGTAVVLHSRYEQFDSIAGIAAAGSHPLRSAFEPTYNMTANLVAVYPRERAEELLNASFAQFRRDRARRGQEDALREEEAALAAERERAECHLGDVGSLAGVPRAGAALAEFAGATAAGDVLSWDSGGRRVLRVVVARGHGKRPRVLAIDLRGELHRMAPEDLPAGVVLAGRIDLPRPYEARRPAYRRKVAGILRTWSPPDEPLLRPGNADTEAPGPAACPDLSRHLAALRAIPRRERRISSLQKRIGASGAGLVPQLRAILALLQRRGYASGWTLSESGERLRFIYNELDLLLAEALEEGLFAGLDPAETAALASAFTFERRRDTAAGYWPTAALARRWDRLEALWRTLADDEGQARLTVTRPPEAGFGEIAYRWASGASLGSLFDDEPAGVGDFVRNCRQLIDLLRQIRDLAPEIRETVDPALAAIDRGVVAAAGAL